MTARSVIKSPSLSRPRKVFDVPFVELYAGRLQGVVKSGSDVERVYVSYFEANTGNYYCSTNNNRRCNGFSGSGPCKHLGWLANEAFLQFGAARVVTYLGLVGAEPEKVKTSQDMLRYIRGSLHQVDASMVFSRFLSYLSHVNLPPTTMPVPEMNWFVR